MKTIWTKVRNAAPALVALAWLFPPAPLNAQEIQFPLIQALAWIPPQENRLLPPGGRSWEFSLDDANIFSFTQDRQAVNDISVFSAYLFHRRALSAGLTLEIAVGVRKYYDSGMDQFIKKVDSALGFSDSGRDLFPEKTIHYRYQDHFNYVRNMWAPAPLVVGLVARILRAGDVAVNGRMGLGFSLANKPGISSGKAYALAGVVGEYSRGKLAVSAGLQAVFFNRPDWLAGEDTRRSYIQAEMQAHLSHWTLGLILRTSPLTFSDNANPGKMMYIGYRIKDFLEIGLMEDLPPMDTVPDVAMYLKLRLGRAQPSR
jgi:hypothetical protein